MELVPSVEEANPSYYFAPCIVLFFSTSSKKYTLEIYRLDTPNFHVWSRRYIFQTIIFGIYVKSPGCISFPTILDLKSKWLKVDEGWNKPFLPLRAWLVKACPVFVLQTSKPLNPSLWAEWSFIKMFHVTIDYGSVENCRGIWKVNYDYRRYDRFWLIHEGFVHKFVVFFLTHTQRKMRETWWDTILEFPPPTIPWKIL